MSRHEGDYNRGTFEQREDGRLNRSGQVFEVLVFLFLIVPSLALSFASNASNSSVGFPLTAGATILRDLALVSLIYYFIWHNREPLRSIGWRFATGGRDILLGIALFIPFTYAAGLLESALQAAGLSAPSAPTPSFLEPQGAWQFVLAFLLVSVVAVSEETIFRGYLMLRFDNILVSPALAALLSSIVFAIGHGYEGSAGVITVGFMGAVFAAVYIWRRSLVAPMTMHFLQDFLGIILLPLLGLG